ncbi:MAG: hypothetical protein NWE93_11475 [Candidatus Bathyarchaeota archaeon]|nr:hypothetical protein [Candidatus Bathyarchaeota archaeon]
MRHRHQTKKTHVCFVEYDDVNFDKLRDARYFGEGNSRGRRLEFDFTYCLNCQMRLLNDQPVMTRDILEDEFERYVALAKSGGYLAAEERTVQHSDFEALEHLIESAIELGKLKAKQDSCP